MQNFFANIYKSWLGGLVSRQLSRPTGLLAAQVGKDMNISNESLYRNIISQPSFITHQHILEIGFGNGHFFEEMFKANQDLCISGVEMSDTMMAEAGKKNRQLIWENKIRLFKATHGLPFEDDSFQAVIAVNLVYFWKDVSKEIAEIHRCLEPNGLVYIGMRPYDILKNLPFAGKEFNLQPEPLWIGQFEENGFSLVSSQTFSEPDTFFGGQSLPMAGTVLIFKKQ